MTTATPNLGFMSMMMQQQATDQKNDAPKEPPKVEMISVHSLIPHPDNFYTISDIEALEDAIELRHGVKENLIVTPAEDGKYRVISGHRRRQATLNLLERGAEVNEMIPCRIETFESKTEETIAIILANMATRKLTEWEKIEQYKRLKEPLAAYCTKHKIPGRMRDFIAQNTGISSSKIAKMENISNNLSKDFKEELKNDNINFSTAAELAGLPLEQQKEVFQEHKEKGQLSIKDVQKKKEEAKTEENPYITAAAEDLSNMLFDKIEKLKTKEAGEKSKEKKKGLQSQIKYLQKYLDKVNGDLK